MQKNLLLMFCWITMMYLLYWRNGGLDPKIDAGKLQVLNDGKLEKKTRKVRTGKAKHEKMTHEEKETCRSHEHRGRCYFFRGGGCNVPPTYPPPLNTFSVSIDNCNCFGDELKAKAPPETRPGKSINCLGRLKGFIQLNQQNSKFTRGKSSKQQLGPLVIVRWINVLTTKGVILVWGDFLSALNHLWALRLTFT